MRWINEFIATIYSYTYISEERVGKKGTVKEKSRYIVEYV